MPTFRRERLRCGCYEAAPKAPAAYPILSTGEHDNDAEARTAHILTFRRERLPCGCCEATPEAIAAYPISGTGEPDSEVEAGPASHADALARAV